MKVKVSSWWEKMNKKAVAALSALSALLIVGFLVGFMGMPGGRAGGPSGQSGQTGGQSGEIRTVSLTRGDLSSTVSATGTVYSVNSVDVYSNLSYPVKTVHVEVGDTVSEGDVLIELDSASLESDIAQKQASVWASQQSAQQSLATAQQDLDTYKKNLEQNYDSNVLNAESSVTTAELELQAAELDVQSAANDARTARRNYTDARDGNTDDGVDATDSELDQLRDTLYAKETALEKSQTNLEKAQANLEKAKATLESVQAGTEDSIATYENKVKSAQINTNFNDQYLSIQKLQDDLGKCVITAPASGTITAVNVVPGASGSGLLAVIQSTGDLKVVTNIKEYDIDSVAIGDKVVIKTDATGNREFTGTLTKIAPTSTLTTTGTASTSTDAEFESEVTVSSGADGLRVGMNARLSIITEEKTDIFSVPYEAVVTGPDGQSYIYVMSAAEDGSTTAERVPVTTGMETNLYIEVSGDSLAEGMQVARDGSSVNTGADLPEGAAGRPDQAGTSEGGTDNA